jgi:hypothetical protein
MSSLHYFVVPARPYEFIADGANSCRGLLRSARRCKARDLTLHPAHTWQKPNPPGVANCNGPEVPVGGGLDTTRRTLSGCTVTCHVG